VKASSILSQKKVLLKTSKQRNCSETEKVKMAKGEESVLVVVRCRPLNAREIEQELEESGGRSKKKEDKHESHTSTPSSTGANAFVGGCVNMLPKMGLVI
jgi:hypothetical protein